uniref:Uncharacterized protein n=1 Tax=Bionectria ochroleuca TaxID=29856 RepID=A0A8H7NK83_BIOOC
MPRHRRSTSGLRLPPPTTSTHGTPAQENLQAKEAGQHRSATPLLGLQHAELPIRGLSEGKHSKSSHASAYPTLSIKHNQGSMPTRIIPPMRWLIDKLTGVLPPSFGVRPGLPR